jgi:hypothetical protein
MSWDKCRELVRLFPLDLDAKKTFVTLELPIYIYERYAWVIRLYNQLTRKKKGVVHLRCLAITSIIG